MSISTEVIDELNMLTLFDVSNNQEGIKIHSTAGTSAIDASTRLYDKGLITQKDGGYLTDLGMESALHAQTLLSILTTNAEA